MKSKIAKTVLNSRNLKILSAKKEDIKDAVVFVKVNENLDKSNISDSLRQIAEEMEKIEPRGCYFIGTKEYELNIYDKAELKNKNLLVTLTHREEFDEQQRENIEKGFQKALPNVKSLTFVHHFADIQFQ